MYVRTYICTYVRPTGRTNWVPIGYQLGTNWVPIGYPINININNINNININTININNININTVYPVVIALSNSP